MKYKGVMPSFITPPSGVSHNFMRAMHKSYRAGAFTHDWSAHLGTRVALARTMNTLEFLGSDAEWNFQIDTDMSWEPDAVIKLRQFAERRNIKVVSGWTVMIKNGVWPHAYRRDEISYVPWGEIDPGTDPLKVEAVGSACLLVHRQVYEDMMEHTKEFTNYFWNEEVYDPDLGYHMGQDISFSDRIHKFTDHEIWYHPGAVFFHHKMTPYGPMEYLSFQKRLQEQINAKLHAANIQPADPESPG